MEAPVRLPLERRLDPRVRQFPIAHAGPAVQAPDPRVDRRAYEAFYHEHDEDWSMPSYAHCDLVVRLHDQLGCLAGAGCVASELNSYWIQGQNTVYLRPDVMVGRPPQPHREARSYRTWEHGPLALVVEIASDESRERDQHEKVADYAAGLRPEEYLYYDPQNDDLILYRWTPAGYATVAADAEGRVWSQAVGCWFGVRSPGHLWVYTADGQPLPDHAEAVDRAAAEAAARSAAETRLAAETAARAAAEAESAAETAARVTAETQLAVEVDARAAAEAESAAEATARRQAEARAAAAEAEAAAETAARRAAEAEAAALREQLAALLRRLHP